MNHDRPLTKHPMRWLALASLSLAAASSTTTAHAAPPAPEATAQVTPWLGLWQGQIGKNSVVVSIAIDPDTQRVEGRYFYERYGRDLSLWGPASSPTGTEPLQLTECPPDYGSTETVCEQPSGTLSLNPPNAAGQIEGRWQAKGLPGRRPLPGLLLSLKRIGTYNPTADAFKDPYEQRRQRGMKPKVSAGGQMGPVAWQNLLDARTKLSVPQLTKGASPKVLAVINGQLKKSWQERINNSLTAVDHDDEMAVAFANERWVATTYSLGAYFPGAAHPINTFTANTYDLKTGQAVDWTRWFRFTTPQSQSIDINRRDLLASQVLKALTTLVATGVDGGGTPDESCAQIVLAHYHCKGGLCASGELMGGRVPTDWQIWPTPKGLAVSPDIYSEVDRACRGNNVLLPWAQARTALLRPQALP